jgi:hypothetical protein
MRIGARRFAARRERGTILFIALIVLVAMSLAGIALMRSVDTNVLIAGNLVFRQSATAGADWGIEDARSWITANAAVLDNDLPAGAGFYWANWQDNTDLINNNPDPTVQDYNWESTDPSNQPRDLGFDQAGNRVQYVIHRLCKGAGPSGAVQCVKSTLFTGGSDDPGKSHGTPPIGGGNVPTTSSVLYRVTVKVTGPRNSVSFVQAVLS